MLIHSHKSPVLYGWTMRRSSQPDKTAIPKSGKSKRFKSTKRTHNIYDFSGSLHSYWLIAICHWILLQSNWNKRIIITDTQQNTWSILFIHKFCLVLFGGLCCLIWLNRRFWTKTSTDSFYYSQIHIGAKLAHFSNQLKCMNHSVYETIWRKT